MANKCESRLTQAESLARVVHKGLGQTTLAGIRKILEAIAEENHAYGCVLWEASRSFSYEENRGALFPLAQWFSDAEVWREHSIPIRSAIGFLLSRPEQKRLNIPDSAVDPWHRLIYPAPFVKDHNLSRLFLIALTLGDGAPGCLVLYRQSTALPFDDGECDQAQLMADLVPALYETIRDEVAYRLTFEVNRELQNADIHYSSLEGFRQSVMRLGKNLVECLKHDLHALDVSMFLALRDDSAAFEMVGTTLSHPEQAGPLILTPPATGDPIGPALAGTALLQLNLGRTDPNTSAETRYAKHMDSLLKKVGRRDAPLSYVAVPISVSVERTLGAIRCCAPFDGPMYFAEREKQLLTVLAGQVGQFFSDSRNRWRLSGENAAWSAVTDALQTFADPLEREGKLDSDTVVQSAVNSIHRALGPETRVQARISVDPGDSATFATSAVPRTGQTLSSSARIGGGDASSFGSLTIEYPPHLPMSDNIRRIAGLFGLQVGHYYNLARLGEQHKRALMSFQHQIRAPLRHAVRRFPNALRLARGLSDKEALREKLIQQLQFLNGINRRAFRIAMTMRIFSRLESGLPLEIQFQEHFFSDIKKFLIEAVIDNNAISDPTRAIRFTVDGESFDALPKNGKISLDQNLLDQAVNDLLDNAGKYSFSDTDVYISAKLTRAYLSITVSNTGLRIGPDQVADIVKKGVRGPLASKQVAEGNGLGLWIVDAIMKAHDGRLELVPTDPKGLTEVRLMFPLQRSKS